MQMSPAPASKWLPHYLHADLYYLPPDAYWQVSVRVWAHGKWGVGMGDGKGQRPSKLSLGVTGRGRGERRREEREGSREGRRVTPALS